MNNNQKQNRKTKMKYPQTKTEVKRDLLAITKKLQYLQLTVSTLFNQFDFVYLIKFLICTG
jgi:hypothetical protein